MELTAVEHQEKIIREHVARIDVARYYLESELIGIFRADDRPFAETTQSVIAEKSEREIWRLLEALSYTYRINGVFSYVTNKGVDWHEAEISVDAIALTGFNPVVDKIVASESVGRHPAVFAKYLQAYFAKHPNDNDDPGRLNEFRPKKTTGSYDRILVFERRGRLYMLDGGHRLVALAMDGIEKVSAYVAAPNDKKNRSMRGDSTFETLRSIYDKARNEQDRTAILATTRILMNRSIDGRDAVKKYWIEHGRKQKVVDAGYTLLEQRKRPAQQS